MTPERIAELRAIIAAATPGPWLTEFGDFCYAVNDFGTNRMQFSIDGGNIEQGIYGKKRTPKEELHANVSLAQAARNDLPQALDTIEAQQRRIEELEAAISWAYETLMEINVSNYTHDDVCNLNNRSVEVILGLAALQPKETK
jgi:hypothetical protein